MTSSRYVTRRMDRTDIDDALAQMSADQLHEIIRAALPELDRRAYERVANSVVDCAARGGSGWVPAAVSGDDVSAIVAFIDAARRLGRADPSEIERSILQPEGPVLAAPEIDQILAWADSGVPVNDEMREALIASMRQGAERRVEGVTGQRRRQHYEHAASLVAICASVDRSPLTGRWVTRVRTEHRRYPALCAAIDRQLDGGRGPIHASR